MLAWFVSTIFPLVLALSGMWARVLGLVSRVFPPLGRLYDLVATTVVCALRLFAGNTFAFNTPKRRAEKPPKPLVLYEFEGCPFCRRVREALSVLALDVIVYPCPRETLKQYGFCKDSRFRPEVLAKGGKLQFPFLIDPNQGNRQMYESDAIVSYLWQTYGARATKPANYAIVTSSLARALELPLTMLVNPFLRCLPEHGHLRVPSKRPERPLELWGHQGSPFVMMVRERLCSLELPYLYHHLPRGDTEGRQDFKDRFGARINTWRRTLGFVKIPFLIDPNTGVELFESGDIVAYLDEQYRVGPPPNESFADYSSKGASSTHGTLGGRKHD
ncbi:glutathione S-transferase domain-containing protein [Salpingoeca rosetta]|uniref:Glutathione S-transferase domain-containing protein n=1 Tax=Salpingoeca rosetta (strain ATCC 50818 / BSB-021) TaxID=946362 RepID=F2USD7_SALR5|nr:glutathione S-transferase domain-containing protein [Salpingoeca rosetta]EGD81046.1 glutathione S-transferase domain-containing protein [Salpingoeca rosetta]|eukprot:XP_004987916.1 glutathione S-transferase domain-containing protein [Salpingoeca rosetta]